MFHRHFLRSSWLLATALGFSLLPAWADGPINPFVGLDQNGNRISDVYEALFTGSVSGISEHADTDSDGMANVDEAAAGTNFSDPKDVLGFTSVTQSPGQITGNWKTKLGKGYQMQAATVLGGTWTNEGAEMSGTGNILSASCPTTGNRMFLRVLVKDKDTDGDGATDWEELQAGTDPNVWDSDGDGRNDLEVIKGIVLAPNVVNVFATQRWTREGDTKLGVFTLTRRGGFQALNLSYTITGSATSGTDFTLSNSSGNVSFAPGVMSATISVTALADAILENAETVVLTLQNGPGYSVGSAGAATVTIVSQGLIGQYFNNSSGTYTFAPTAGANFDPASLGITRRDPNVSFNWSKPAGTPPGPGNGVPGVGITDDDVWGARWTGFVIPKYNEVYQLAATGDRGLKVYVSQNPIEGLVAAQLRLDFWTTTDPSTPVTPNNMLSSSEVSTRIMEAGRPYYFQVDYRDSATNSNNANIDIRWSSPSQPEESIPTSALTSEGFIGTAPIISSPLVTVGLVGAPFLYSITGSNTPTTFTADGLPLGLSFNATTGVISGVVTGSSGVYFATISAGNGGGSDVKNLTIFVIGTEGLINRQVWTTGLTSSGVEGVPVWTAPTSTTTLTTTQAPSNTGDQFGDRLRGYITAPISGNYLFYTTADENAELWVSSTKEPAQTLKRSWVKNGAVAPGVYDTQPSQKSIHMRLKAGDSVYFEAIRRETVGNDHLAVAWQKPGDTVPEVIPSYALSTYTAADELATTDTIYLANLTPQSGAITLGSGSAILRVNAAKTQGILTFTYANLSGPIISEHIHDGRNLPGFFTAIIFDVDDAVPDSQGRRTWTFAPTGVHTLADVIAAVETGNSYLNLHTELYPSGEVKGFFRKVNGSRVFVPPAAGAAPELTLPTNATQRKQEIVRFLQQATFGARNDTDGVAPWDADSIENVDALGYAAWIDAQIALDRGPDPETLVTQTLPPRILYIEPSAALPTLIPAGTANGYNGSGPLGSFVNSYYEKFPLSSVGTVGAPLEDATDIWRAWWKSMAQRPDQLRHRTAFALSQTLVVSEDGELDQLTRAMVHYHDLLYYYGLGNFRTLLEKVTLNPSMGRYLDMLNNKKPNPAIGYIPNENFGREILQLFSVGLRRLHPDGSLVLNSNYLPVDTYGQENVVGLAHVFTGWKQPASGSNYISPMNTNPADHDIGEKLLLDSAVIPATATATTVSCDQELAATLDVIFHHPNIGPFICRQLIQRMVTANPTPGYVHRISKIFNDNGSGVRGDLGAVVKALLLDSEARNQAARALPSFGHVKEPVIRATQMLRAFKGFSYGEVNYGSVNLRGMVTASPNNNVNVAIPLPVSTYTRVSASSTRALFAGNVITLSGQTPTTDNGLYIFNGNGLPLTPTTTGTSVATYTTDLADIATTALPTSDFPVIEGLPLNIGTKLLLRNQTNAAENGIYMLTSVTSALTRWDGYDEPAEINASRVTVAAFRDPTTLVYSTKTFAQTATFVTLGTSPLTFIDSSATTSGKRAWEMGSASSLAQTPLRAPTVFNFYEPDYVFAGDTGNEGLYGPEFQITTETNVVNTANWFYTFARRNSAATTAQTRGQGFAYDSTTLYNDIKLDLTFERSIAANSATLVDHVATMLMPGQMSAALRTILINHLNTLPSTTDANKMDRVSELLYFISLSPEFALQN